jgi:hypothetical protein
VTVISAKDASWPDLAEQEADGRISKAVAGANS